SASMRVERNVIVGWLAMSKKSFVRRWLSRSASPVSIDSSCTSTETFDWSGSSAISTSPETSENEPRTLAIIMWRTVNPTWVWEGSIVHFPDGMGLAMGVSFSVGQQQLRTQGYRLRRQLLHSG